MEQKLAFGLSLLINLSFSLTFAEIVERTVPHTQSHIAYDFGFDWTIFLNPETSPMNKNFSFFENDSQTITRTKNLLSKPYTSFSFYDYSISNGSYFWLRHSENNSSKIGIYKANEINPIYESSINVNDVSFGRTFLSYLNADSKTVFRVSLPNLNLLTMTFNSSDSPVAIAGSNGFVIVYCKDETPLSIYGYYYLLRELDLSIISRVRTRYDPISGGLITHVNMNYDNETNMLVKATNFLTLSNGGIYVYDGSSGTELWTKTFIDDQVVDSMICKRILIILMKKQVKFFRVSDWGEIGFKAIDSTNFVPEKGLKCFNYRFAVGFMIKSKTDATKTVNVYYQIGNYTEEPSANETTNSTDNDTNNETINETTNETTNETNNETDNQTIPEPTKPTIPQNQSLPPNASIEEFNKKLTELITSEEFKSSSSAISSMTGMLASNPMSRAYIRPLFNLLDDFWFYGFHPIFYPDFVEIFTSEIDTLNELKIKPSFLDFEINVEKFQEQNNLTINAQNQLDGAPETVFMFESIKDIYTMNLAMNMVQFGVLLLLKALFFQLKNKHKILKRIFIFFEDRCFWWCLCLSIFEPNISPIIFYGSVQFNNLFCFDYFSKLNLLFCIYTVFVVIFFSFCFFSLVNFFEKRKVSQGVLDYTLFNPKSFFLETSCRCLRNFFQGFIHGSFLKFFPITLPLLMLLDIFFICLIFKNRKLYIYKFNFALSFLYFLAFLAFDAFLLTYVIRRNQTANESLHSDEKINLISIIIVITLFVITILKLVLGIAADLLELLKRMCKKTKVMNSTSEINPNQLKFKITTKNIGTSKTIKTPNKETKMVAYPTAISIKLHTPKKKRLHEKETTKDKSSNAEEKKQKMSTDNKNTFLVPEVRRRRPKLVKKAKEEQLNESNLIYRNSLMFSENENSSNSEFFNIDELRLRKQTQLSNRVDAMIQNNTNPRMNSR